MSRKISFFKYIFLSNGKLPIFITAYRKENLDIFGVT